MSKFGMSCWCIIKLLWLYWPVMPAARAGQHEGVETSALAKNFPDESHWTVFGMYAAICAGDWSRMSSSTMFKTFGLAAAAAPALGAVAVTLTKA